jgi:hypothetical protein
VTGNDRRRRAVPAAIIPAAATVGLFVLVWAATTGPPRLLDPSRRLVRPAHRPTPTTSPSSQGADPMRALHRRPPLHDLSWIGDLLSWAVLILLAAAFLTVAVWLWRHRWRPEARPRQLDFDVLPELDTLPAAISDDAAVQLADLEQGSPGDGIVRCWLRLEEVIAVAGLPRDPAETSTEFTVRVLHHLDLDPRAIGRLAALYREARFSGHLMGEASRAAARSSLRQLHRELGAGVG